MLENYCEKAGLMDGLKILDLGCGWGSLSLFLAEKYPNAKITGLSNSKTQKVYIDEVAQGKGLDNLTVSVHILCDNCNTDCSVDRHCGR